MRAAAQRARPRPPPARSARSAQECRRDARAAAAARRRRSTAATSSAASKRPSAARFAERLRRSSHTSTMLCLSSFGSRNASPFCSAREYWPISAQYSDALARLLEQRQRIVARAARRSASTTNGRSGRLQRARGDVVARAGLAEDQHRTARGEQRFERLLRLADRRARAERGERNAPRLLALRRS